MDVTRFRGSQVALVTPFDAEDEIDTPALERLVDFHLENGTDGLVVCGTTGEGATLSEAQFEHVVKTVVQRVQGRIPVTAGTGSNNTAIAIERTQRAKKLGVDAALVVGPYYNKPTQDGYFKHFKAVAEQADLPIIVYNVPGRTAGMIDWRTLLRLAVLDNIFAVKEASADFNQLTQLIRKRPDDFLVLSGDDGLSMAQIAAGADGVISVVANEVPALMARMIHAALEGDFKTAREINHKMYPLMTVNFIESNPIPVKCALAEMGLIQEYYHLPLTRITEVNRNRVKNILKDLGIETGKNNVNKTRY